LTAALDLLLTLPETRERSQQELAIQITLSMALRVKGGGAPEVERLYTRARALCEQIGELPQLFRVLLGLWLVYYQRGEYQIRTDSDVHRDFEKKHQGRRHQRSATDSRHADEGADVAVQFNRGREAAQAVVEKVQGLGRKAVALQADVTDPVSLETMQKKLPPIDILYCSAGLGTLPPAWLSALTVGGRMVMPMTDANEYGLLFLFRKITEDGPWLAKMLSFTRHYPCLGTRETSDLAALSTALATPPTQTTHWVPKRSSKPLAGRAGLVGDAHDQRRVRITDSN